MPDFRIEDTVLSAPIDPREGDGYLVASTPRPYRVDWLSRQNLGEALRDLFTSASHPLVLIDRRVEALYLKEGDIPEGVSVLRVDSNENYKTIEGALELCAFLDASGASKASMLLVIGGGIVQDVAGFACAIYKRGIPWTYVPTTFLAQGDSGMGGKAGLNYNGAKNILALFSAPRRVVIHTGFLNSLSDLDVLSGLGEVFRLHVTGGPEMLDVYEQRIARFFRGERDVLNELLVSALSVKRAVIEEDEFELNIRRAMNYGHSIGHAFEALTDHAIPHGTAVVVGMLVENELSLERDLLSRAEHVRLLANARPLVPARVRSLLREIDLSGILDVLAKDKKSEGKVLKLALLERLGQIRFVSLPLDLATLDALRRALDTVINHLAEENEEGQRSAAVKSEPQHA